MAFQVAEHDDDAVRVEKAVVQALSIPVRNLVALQLAKGSPEGRFVEAMDVMVCVFRQMPAREEVKRIKELAWKYRRRMPRGGAPKLPPADPVVQQMEDV
jgi:hypothetical protein